MMDRFILLDFKNRVVRWITAEDAARMVAEQEARGVVTSSGGMLPPLVNRDPGDEDAA